MSARRGTPRAVLVTAALGAVVFAAALGGAAVLRARATDGAEAVASPPTTTTGASGCLREPCQVLGTEAVGGASVELVADAGGASGRLRVGGPSGGQVIEVTITEDGAVLGPGSLLCRAGAMSACLVRGAGEQGVTGQVVVSRSGVWNALEAVYLSSAGHLTIAEVDATFTGPEIVAVQHDCGGCGQGQVHAQVFSLTGEEAGCSRSYPSVADLPGHPEPALTKAQLRPCG